MLLSTKKQVYLLFPRFVRNRVVWGYIADLVGWGYSGRILLFSSLFEGVPPVSAEPEKVGVPPTRGVPTFRLSPPPQRFVQVPRTPIYTRFSTPLTNPLEGGSRGGCTFVQGSENLISSHRGPFLGGGLGGGLKVCPVGGNSRKTGPKTRKSDPPSKK